MAAGRRGGSKPAGGFELTPRPASPNIFQSMISVLTDLIELAVWLYVELWEFVSLDDHRVRGKIDRTPEGLYVGTEFWCFLGVTLVPGRTKIYTDESLTKFYDFTIGRSWRSVLAAYLRCGLWSTAILSGVLACVGSLLLLLGARDPDRWVLIGWAVCGVTLAGALLSMRLFAKASPERTQEMRDTLGRGVTPKGPRGFEVSAGRGGRPRA